MVLVFSGAGNTPAVIDETASIEMAVSSIILSKTFDNGVICASEQSVVVCDKVYDKVKAEFQRRGAHFLNEEEKVRGGSVQIAEAFYDGLSNLVVMPRSTPLPDLFGVHDRSRSAPRSPLTANSTPTLWGKALRSWVRYAVSICPSGPE